MASDYRWYILYEANTITGDAVTERPGQPKSLKEERPNTRRPRICGGKTGYAGESIASPSQPRARQRFDSLLLLNGRRSRSLSRSRLGLRRLRLQALQHRAAGIAMFAGVHRQGNRRDHERYG